MFPALNGGVYIQEANIRDTDVREYTSDILRNLTFRGLKVEIILLQDSLTSFGEDVGFEVGDGGWRLWFSALFR